MMSEKRKDIRFDDVARVEAFELCVFPGVLVDISHKGCKIRFPIPFDFELDKDYELKIIPSQKNETTGFVLIGHPMWKNKSAAFTEIGFEILHSPGISRFKEYLNDLEQFEKETNEESAIIDRLCLSI